MYPQNARRGYRERNMRRKANERQLFIPKKEDKMLKNIVICVLVLFVLSSCCLGTLLTTGVGTYIFWPKAEEKVSIPVIVESAPACNDCDSAPTEPLAPAAAPVAAWDNTCATQSALVGVELKPLAEGNFFACVFNGKPSKVSIPAGTIADIDLGGIFVATGPVTIDNVPNMTLRQWNTGKVAEACSQVKNLSDYGQLQSPKFTASPYNFDCN